MGWEAIGRMWKGYNRFLCARILGDYRVPTSYHLGKIKPFRKWVKYFCGVLSYVFKQKTHCSSVATKDMTYFPLDPMGKYAGPLLLFWLLFDLFMLGSTGYAIYSLVSLI